MERRLAAILIADVVGYSRLIQADEEGTIAALKALRVDFIDPKIAEHHGRIVKLMGDGMLAEFGSIVDAVRAAVETQTAVAEHNAGLPEDKRIEFRVGINVGDIVVDGEDIHGDGVNVAARLESMAEPGGILISSTAHDQVRDKLDVGFEDKGEVTAKNIARPVRVFKVQPRGWHPSSVVGAMTYLFGDCALDTGLHELRRNGLVCVVEPQVFDLLLYLIKNRNRMVGKDELNQRIWGSRIVSDASLSTCLKLAR
jgi:class 3 adenylate cyclase